MKINRSLKEYELALLDYLAATEEDVNISEDGGKYEFEFNYDGSEGYYTDQGHVTAYCAGLSGEGSDKSEAEADWLDHICVYHSAPENRPAGFNRFFKN